MAFKTEAERALVNLPRNLVDPPRSDVKGQTKRVSEARVNRLETSRLSRVVDQKVNLRV